MYLDGGGSIHASRLGCHWECYRTRQECGRRTCQLHKVAGGRSKIEVAAAGANISQSDAAQYRRCRDADTRVGDGQANTKTVLLPLCWLRHDDFPPTLNSLLIALKLTLHLIICLDLFNSPPVLTVAPQGVPPSLPLQFPLRRSRAILSLLLNLSTFSLSLNLAP